MTPTPRAKRAAPVNNSACADEERFCALFDASPDAAWISDGERLVECNRVAAKLLGYADKTALIGVDPASLAPELQPSGEASAAAARACDARAREDGLQHFEWVFRQADGSPLVAEVSLAPVRLQGRAHLYTVWRDVTLRRERDARIRQLLDEQRVLFENALVGIMLVQRRRILKCNQRIAELFGYADPQELVGQSVEIFYPDRASFEIFGKGAYGDLARQGSTSREVKMRRRDGSPLYVLQNGCSLDPVAVFDAPSVWVYTDITQHRRTEEALRQSRQSFSVAFESCPIAASIASPEDGRFIEVNANYERDFGWTREELIGRSSLEIGLWPDRAARDAWLAAMRAAGRLVNHETVWRARNGELRHVSLSSEIIAIGGEARLLAYVSDITARKLTEADLRIAAAAFESQEAMIVTDAASVILRVNQAFTRLTGYSAEELIGKTPQVFKSGRHDAAFYHDMWRTIAETGRWQGEIWDRKKNGETFPKWLTVSAVKDETGVVTHYIGSQFDITERKLAEERIQALAYSDQLTGLANRASLSEQLGHTVRRAARNGRIFALMLLDLDNFKSVNDSLGHHVGDQLLVAVAAQLRGAVRQSDLVARLGGDEFVILLPEIHGPADAAHVADKILAALAAPGLVAGHDVRTSPSIGICLYPSDASDSLDLLQRADAAMYHAKANGRNQYQFFQEEFQRAALERLALEADLRRAVAEGQFLLHYQPQLDLKSGRVVGVEALVRWRHPQRGLVPPSDFIPLAEETGLILSIGTWVIEEACRQLAEWRSQGLKDLGMSINLAANQLLDADLPASVRALIARHRIPPALITLEVTESMSMASPEKTIASMQQLAALGVWLSIDDFGTGYSSLAYLKLFPLHTLKIDRSFVKDIETDRNDADICDVTVLLAHRLGLDVVAEGVEKPAQLKYLRSIGCEKVQGYLVSRPLPADELARFVAGADSRKWRSGVDLWDEPGGV